MLFCAVSFDGMDKSYLSVSVCANSFNSCLTKPPKNDYDQACIELKSLQEKLLLMGQQESDIQGLAEDRVSPLFTLTAPFDGTVIEKNVATGELKNAFSPTVTVADLSHLWVWFDIYEKDISKVKVGNKVMIAVGAYPDEQFEGLVTHTGAIVDEKTRTVKVRVEVDNHHQKLKPGMFARVMLLLSSTSGNDFSGCNGGNNPDGRRKILCLCAA